MRLRGSATLTVWQNFRFAPDWFEDTRQEAGVSGTPARRREIVFAVCFIESYLYEWVLNEVLATASIPRSVSAITINA